MKNNTANLTIGQRFALNWMMKKALANDPKERQSHLFSGKSFEEVFTLVSEAVDEEVKRHQQSLDRGLEDALGNNGRSTIEGREIDFTKAVENSPTMRTALKGPFG